MPLIPPLLPPITLDAETAWIGCHRMPLCYFLGSVVFGSRVFWGYHHQVESQNSEFVEDELGVMAIDLQHPQAPPQQWRLPVQMPRHQSLSGQDPCVERRCKLVTVIGDAPIFRVITTYRSRWNKQYFPYYIYGFSASQQQWYRLEPDTQKGIAIQTWLTPEPLHSEATSEDRMAEHLEHYFGKSSAFSWVPDLTLTAKGKLEVTFTYECSAHFEFEDDSPRYERSYLKASDGKRFPRRQDTGHQLWLEPLHDDRWQSQPTVNPQSPTPEQAYVITNLERCVTQHLGLPQKVLKYGQPRSFVPMAAIDQQATWFVIWFETIAAVAILHHSFINS
jgi:hypothetical protein